jgi:TetR/AcrR family transcriptional regulator, tetracycline repressor protein
VPGVLTKAAIVQAALDLLDETGMDGLTVRALASRLGVQAPALYWHVRNKQALLDEMATQVWREIGDVMAALPRDLPWREVMAVYAVTVRRELLGHRDGAKAFSGTTLTDPEVIRRQENTFEDLVRQGFTVQDATRGLVMIHYFTIGFCVEEQAVAQVTASGDDSYSRRADLIGAQNAPLVVEAGDVLFGDPDARFTELLDLQLETVARLRNQASGLDNTAKLRSGRFGIPNRALP